MRVTRSMTGSSAPKKKEKKQEKKQLKFPKEEHPIVEFITAEELASRNVEKCRYINLINVAEADDMIRFYPSFEKPEREYVAENRIYAVVPEGYSWGLEKVYGGGCYCYYIKNN
jgi:hypothetical protein